MNDPIRIFIWAVGGLILLLCALLVPAHFRAVDRKLIESAGMETPSIVESGVGLVNLEKPEAARMLWRAAQTLEVSGHESLGAAIAQAERMGSPTSIAKTDPVFETFNELFRPTLPRPIIEPLLERSTRLKLAEFLQFSRRAGVQEILKNRMLTNT